MEEEDKENAQREEEMAMEEERKNEEDKQQRVRIRRWAERLHVTKGSMLTLERDSVHLMQAITKLERMLTWPTRREEKPEEE